MESGPSLARNTVAAGSSSTRSSGRDSFFVSFADISKRGRITQDVDRLFELGKVFGADQNGGRAAVPGQHDALMLTLDAVHLLR
jgi:hypothetical protein